MIINSPIKLNNVKQDFNDYEVTAWAADRPPRVCRLLRPEPGGTWFATAPLHHSSYTRLSDDIKCKPACFQVLNINVCFLSSCSFALFFILPPSAGTQVGLEYQRPGRKKF